METTLYEGWTILELLGHRRLAGYVREETVFGVSLIRIDIPQHQGTTTQYYSASALYAMTPTTEAIAHAVAANNQPTPVHRWELPAPAEKVGVHHDSAHDAEPYDYSTDCAEDEC